MLSVYEKDLVFAYVFSMHVLCFHVGATVQNLGSCLVLWQNCNATYRPGTVSVLGHFLNFCVDESKQMIQNLMVVLEMKNSRSF